MLGLIASSHAYPRPGQIEVASAAADKGQGNGLSGLGDFNAGWGHWSPSQITPTGRYVAFRSDASNLVAGDTNRMSDVFVRDLVTNKTEIASLAQDGTLAKGCYTRLAGSAEPTISSDGRFVAFSSCATNLEGGFNPAQQVGVADYAINAYVRDLKMGTTERVSVAVDGSYPHKAGTAPLVPAIVDSPFISANGRYVVFQSDADNLVEQVPERVYNIFRYDRKTHVTELVSAARDGSPADSYSYSPFPNASGRFVVFHSMANNLGPADADRPPDPISSDHDVFVKDMETGRVEMINLASNGTQSDDAAGLGHFSNPISADGRYVLFSSGATNLVPNGKGSIYMRDRKTGRTTRVVVSSTGDAPGTGGCREAPAISPDGRYVSFSSTPFAATTSPLSPCATLIYIHDNLTGALNQVSSTSDNASSECPTLPNNGTVSEGGRFVSYDTCVPQTSGDTNDLGDVFVRDMGDDLGIGAWGSGAAQGETPPDDICLAPDVCIPPGGITSSRDAIGDTPARFTEEGANIYGASLAYRPSTSDMLATIELEYMPRVIPGLSPIFYGLRFGVDDRSYEVRGTSLLGGTFGLFECTDSTCTKVADLRGGYGTTGMRVVFSLPLDQVGLEDGGELSDVEAFSSLGTYETGAAMVLDTVQLAERSRARTSMSPTRRIADH